MLPLSEGLVQWAMNKIYHEHLLYSYSMSVSPYLQPQILAAKRQYRESFGHRAQPISYPLDHSRSFGLSKIYIWLLSTNIFNTYCLLSLVRNFNFLIVILIVTSNNMEKENAVIIRFIDHCAAFSVNKKIKLLASLTSLACRTHTTKMM